MNERILELAKRAGLKKDHGSDREYIGDFDWRQFAELIVVDCIKVVDETPLGYGDYRDQILESMRNSSVESIRYHFGVE
jgi:hypothetical protein